jgi:GTPase
VSSSDSDGTGADEGDWELGAEDVAEAIEEAAAPPPVVAVVGRPNVGKSTLSTGSLAAARRWCRTFPV